MTYDFAVAKNGASGFQMTVNSQDKEIKIELERDEFNKIVGYCNNRREAVTLFSATLYPVRTNNFSNFAKDFFLPTVVNQTIKVKDMAAKVFAIIGALFLDLATFPIRLVTFIPRIIMNAVKEEHTLLRYLRQHGKNEVLDSDSVNVFVLQKGLGWQRKEVHFHDFPVSMFYSEHIESGSGQTVVINGA